VRNLREHGLKEGASTRVLIYAGRLIKEGIAPRRACHVAVTWGITDDVQVQRSLDEVVAAIFRNFLCAVCVLSGHPSHDIFRFTRN
jgi:nitric oxide reductase NorQ protein